VIRPPPQRATRPADLISVLLGRHKRPRRGPLGNSKPPSALKRAAINNNRKATVKELRRLARNARYLLLCAAVIGSAATATTLAVAPAASAETNYSCEKCFTTSGRDETIDYAGGTIYRPPHGSPVFAVNIWKNNGGGNYSQVWSASVWEPEYHIEHCLGYEHRIYGHGETNVLYEYEEDRSHLSGKEWLWKNKEGPC
jgi:hypothetical protein